MRHQQRPYRLANSRPISLLPHTQHRRNIGSTYHHSHASTVLAWHPEGIRRHFTVKHSFENVFPGYSNSANKCNKPHPYHLFRSNNTSIYPWPAKSRNRPPQYTPSRPRHSQRNIHCPPRLFLHKTLPHPPRHLANLLHIHRHILNWPLREPCSILHRLGRPRKQHRSPPHPPRLRLPARHGSSRRRHD